MSLVAAVLLVCSGTTQNFQVDMKLTADRSISADFKNLKTGDTFRRDYLKLNRLGMCVGADQITFCKYMLDDNAELRVSLLATKNGGLQKGTLQCRESY